VGSGKIVCACATMAGKFQQKCHNKNKYKLGIFKEIEKASLSSVFRNLHLATAHRSTLA